MGGEQAAEPVRAAATNLVGVPGARIASVAFNRDPVRLSIRGARESARHLFELLDTAATLAEAAEYFRRFMQITFGLVKDPQARARGERLRRKAGYRELLEGWGFDANSPAGAVLKGWVESRFGIVPTYHRAALQRFPSGGWMSNIEEKPVSRFKGNCIDRQLDLLFEFCQYAAYRFSLPAMPIPCRTIPVWRGINSLQEHRIPSGSLRARRAVVHLNNVVSFSLSREHAGTFGDWLLATEVPVQKLIFFPGLLGRYLLSGEGEIIALGGQYEVHATYL